MDLATLRARADRLESELERLATIPHIDNPQIWVDIADGKTDRPRYRKRWMERGRRKSQTIPKAEYDRLSTLLAIGRQIRDKRATLRTTKAYVPD